MKKSVLTIGLLLAASVAPVQAAPALAMTDPQSAALWLVAVLFYFGLDWRSR